MATNGISAASCRDLLTVERLRELYRYDPETGEFTHLRGTGRGRVGTIAGTRRNTGYWTLEVDGVRYLAHRLAWFYVTGAWPAEFIDHIDRDRTNNRFSNLREATPVQNQMNKSSRRGSYSRFVGVTFCQRKKKWKAQIGINRRMIALGYFDTEEAAAAAYQAAKPKYHHQGKALEAG